MSAMTTYHLSLDEGEQRAIRAVQTWRSMFPGRKPRLSVQDKFGSDVRLWLASRSDRAETMSREETVFLNSIFPGWQTMSVDAFDRRLYEASVFFHSHGRLPLPDADDDRERVLGEWIVRKASRSRSGSILLIEAREMDRELPGWRDLTPSGSCRITSISTRRKKSMAAPPSASVRNAATWRRMLSQFEGFYERAHRIPLHTIPEEQKLANWVRNQRASVRRGVMKPADLLSFLLVVRDDPSVVLSVSDEGFDRRLSEVVSGEMDESDAGSWLVAMNVMYWRGGLSDDQVARLDAARPGWREVRSV